MDVMMLIVAASSIILAVAGLFFWIYRIRQRGAGDRQGARVMEDMRTALFNATADEIGVLPTQMLPNVWGVVMEMGYPDNGVTLFALSDGTTSLYRLSGDNILGGEAYDSVRKSATKFLRVAELTCNQAEPAMTYPLPTMDTVRFFILTYGGTLTMEANQSDLKRQDHELFPLFASGRNVLKQLQVIEENRKSK